MMRYLMLLLSLSLMMPSVFADDSPMLNKGVQEYVFIAVWVPNVDNDELNEFVIDGFKDQFPDSNITPVLYRTNNVLAALMSGFAHIGISHSQWTDKDITLLTKKYKKLPLELTLAADAFGVVVNEDNPVTSLSYAEVEGLFVKTAGNDCQISAVRNWQQVSDEKIEGNSDVNVITYSEEDRNPKLFESMLCGEFKGRAVESVDDAIDAVEDDVNAVTFVHFSDELPDNAVPIRTDNGRLIPFREDRIFSREYPLSAVYYMQIAPFAVSRPSTKLYIDYLLSDDVQSQLQERGYMRLPEAMLLRNQVKLEQAEPQYNKGYR